MSLDNLPVIARFEGPIFGIILRYRERPDLSDEWIVHNYSTQRGTDIGGYCTGYHNGGYHFSREEGWADFKERMDRALAYAPFATDQAELEGKEKHFYCM